VEEKNYISVTGNGNIVLQDVTGGNININEISKIKEIFENSEPEYLKALYSQIDDYFGILSAQNNLQTHKIISILQQEMQKRNISVKESKNILTGTISGVGGNVHIGDIIYAEKPNTTIKYIALLAVIVLIIVAGFYLKNLMTDTSDTMTNGSDTMTLSHRITNVDSVANSSDTMTESHRITHAETNLSLELNTSKGKKPVFIENDNVKLFFKANKECYVRIIYQMADGTAVLLVDNMKVTQKDLNKELSAPTDFICSEPFGEELLTAYAQQKPFDKIATQNVDGYDIIQSLQSAYQQSEKGLKKKIEFTKTTIKVLTQPDK